jgi:membrane protease YdiL (CAAX protease family)
MTIAVADPARVRAGVTTAVVASGAYAAAWVGSVLYLRAAGANWVFPLISMTVFAGALSALAWALTRGAAPPGPPVRRPGVELAVLAAFLVVYAVGFLGFGLSAVREAFEAGRAQESAVLTAKLIVHVLAPAVLLALVGAPVLRMFAVRAGHFWFWRTFLGLAAILLGLLAVVTPSLRNIAALEPTVATLAWAAPLAFLWISLEAGLCEEFLFRAGLQSRLEAVTRSPVAAVLVTSTVFALAHAPGLYLRGGPGVDGWSTDPLQVAAFTIATLSPVSIFFGVLWVRTRSLLLCVLLHGAIDFLPNLPEFLRLWT